MTDSELRQFTDCERLHDAVREFILQFERVFQGEPSFKRGQEIRKLIAQLKRVL